MIDISATALDRNRDRLGTQAESVEGIEGDVTRIVLPANRFDVWHDRAVFHFLTAAEDRRSYVELVERSVKPGGHNIVASFGLGDGRDVSDRRRCGENSVN